MFQFCQGIFVFAHLFLDISIKSTKPHFQSWKNFSATISLIFFKITAEVSRNNCSKRHENWKFPWYILNSHLKVSWVKAYQISSLFIFTSIYPLTKRLKGLAVEIYQMKRLLDWFETGATENTEGRLVYKWYIKSYGFKVFDNNHYWKRNEVFIII